MSLSFWTSVIEAFIHFNERLFIIWSLEGHPLARTWQQTKGSRLFIIGWNTIVRTTNRSDQPRLSKVVQTSYCLSQHKQLHKLAMYAPACHQLLHHCQNLKFCILFFFYIFSNTWLLILRPAGGNTCAYPDCGRWLNCQSKNNIPQHYDDDDDDNDDHDEDDGDDDKVFIKDNSDRYDDDDKDLLLVFWGKWSKFKFDKRDFDRVMNWRGRSHSHCVATRDHPITCFAVSQLENMVSTCGLTMFVSGLRAGGTPIPRTVCG